jgi:signal transduction histidine kinase
LSQSALLLGLTSFALGASILARNVRNSLFLAFSSLCLIVAFWATSFVVSRVWNYGFVYQVHLFLNVLLAPSALVFLRVLLRMKDGLSRRVLETAILGAVPAGTAIFLGWQELPWFRYLVLFYPSLIGLQTLRLMYIDYRIQKGIPVRPKRPAVGFRARGGIYIGGLAVMFFAVMDHVPFIGEVLPSFGNIALAFYLYFLSRAITQQRLLNFSALFTRFLVLVVVALTLAGIYWLLVAWIHNSPGLFFLNSFIASFLILTLLDPLRTAVGFLTQRLLTQVDRSFLQQVRDAQASLVGVTDAATLYQRVLDAMQETLAPEGVAIYGLRADGTRYQRSGTRGSITSDVKDLLVNHPLLATFDRLHRRGDIPVIFDQVIENERDRATSTRVRDANAGLMQALKGLNANLLLALRDGDVTFAFVAVRANNPPEPWGGNWGLVQFLIPYLEQAAAQLRGMDVFVRQREKERLATLGEMAAGLAHEIRNPLGAIQGAVQLLNPESATTGDARFLKIIQEEVQRLNRVVSQFLDYSKPSGLELKVLEISPLMDRAVELLAPSLPPGVRIERVAMSPELSGLKVEAAAERLLQVLINLIQNAVKALDAAGSREQEGVVTLSLERYQGIGRADARKIAIVVEDNGPGIPESNLERIFIPFFTTSQQGTGLGLSICQKIVEAHRGRIEVESEPGKRTRFAVILPIHELRGAGRKA